MKIEYAIEHLSKKIKTDFDQQALNTIIEWVNDQRKITLNENQLFAKLFIYLYNQILDRYQSTVFDKIPQVTISKLLKTDLEYFYQAFTDSLNSNEAYHTMKENGIDLKHPAILSDKEKYENDLKLKEMSDSDFDKIAKGTWEIEDVRDELNKMITNALNRFQ